MENSCLSMPAAWEEFCKEAGPFFTLAEAGDSWGRQREAIRNMNEATMDGLIVIGGDGSMRGAHELALQKFNVIGIPASIDNDIWGTNMAIGVDTALNTIMEAVDKLRDTASSHSRAFLIETMGRGSGYLAVMAGVLWWGGVGC